MLKLLLLASSLLSAQQAALDCSNNAAARTPPVPGPNGASAVLEVSTADDHGKNSHECMARYQLRIQPAGGHAPIVAELLSSDGGWARKLSFRLDGFSLDGQSIFGILSETLFDYHTTDGATQLLDLTRSMKQIAAAKCGTSAAIAGTTDTGAIVLESVPATQCTTRWAFDPATKTLYRFPKNKSFLPLFKTAP